MKTKSRILVVEDSPPNRMILCHLLNRLGFDVYEASDGEEALDWLTENQADAVITDLMMPKVDGLELLSNVKGGQAPHTPVFIVTAVGEQDALREAKNRNCDGIILKPISITDLQDHLCPFFPHLETLKRAA